MNPKLEAATETLREALARHHSNGLVLEFMGLSLAYSANAERLLAAGNTLGAALSFSTAKLLRDVALALVKPKEDPEPAEGEGEVIN